MKEFELNLRSLISIRNKIIRRKSYIPSLFMLSKNIVIQTMQPMPALRIKINRKYPSKNALQKYYAKISFLNSVPKQPIRNNINRLHIPKMIKKKMMENRFSNEKEESLRIFKECVINIIDACIRRVSKPRFWVR